MGRLHSHAALSCAMLLLLCLDIQSTIYAAEDRMEGIQSLLYASLQVKSSVTVIEVCLYIRQANAFPVPDALLSQEQG